MRCYNDGVITVDTSSASSVSGNISIGGLIAQSNHGDTYPNVPKGVKMTDCSNRASITLTGPVNKKTIYIGGLYGTHYYALNAISVLTNCTTTKKNIKGEDNKLTVNITNAGTLHLGGATGSASEGSKKDADGNAVILEGGMQFVNCTLGMDMDITLDVADDVTKKDVSIGGVTGYFAPMTHSISGCRNDANITVKGNNGGSLYLGGMTGYANQKTLPFSLTVDNCVNTGTLKVEMDSDAYLIVAGMVARDHSSRVDGCVNTGTIEVTNEASSGQATFLSGIHGWEADAPSTITNCKNSGTIKCNIEKVTNTSDTWYYSSISVGGIIGGNSVVGSKNLTGSGETVTVSPVYQNNVNTGKIEVADVTVAKLHFVGGIIGHPANPVSNCQSYCELSAIGATNAGMIMGAARAEATLVKNCQVGGQIAVTESEKKTWDDDAEDYIWKTSPDWNPLTNENYFTYIYGGTTDWAGVEGYDGCSWLSEAPAVSAL